MLQKENKNKSLKKTPESMYQNLPKYLHPTAADLSFPPGEDRSERIKNPALGHVLTDHNCAQPIVYS